MTRVLMTGASSFTGYWFARNLVDHGATVVALCRQPSHSDDFMRQRRLHSLAAHCKLVFDAPFGSDMFMTQMERHGPFSLLCMNGAEVGWFREKAFDPYGALSSNVLNASQVFKHLRTTGCNRVLITGSVFEADEGAGDRPLSAIGPYGLAKTLSWQALRYEAEAQGIAIGKVTLASPFGPLQTRGLVPYLLDCWFRDSTATLRHPEIIRDFTPIDPLAEAYAQFALQLPTEPGIYRFNPSGIVASVEAFVSDLAEAMQPRLNRPCRFTIEQNNELSEPQVRHNTDPLARLESQLISEPVSVALARSLTSMHEDLSNSIYS